jgi:hypothetical protein
VLSAVFLTALAYVAVLAFPQPLFANYVAYRNFEVWSDRPIDASIERVLDDASRRLRSSELYSSDQSYRIFICNSRWRLWLYSQTFTAQMGGQADTWLTRNVYIREADIASNSIRSPGQGPILDAAQRTLSYYIAHEITHVLESATFGRLMMLQYPQWLLEGYADYVGKGGDFDFDQNRQLLINDDPLLDYRRSGLYRRFHLEVALLLDKKALTIRTIFADPPSEDELLSELRRPPPP